MLAFRTMISLPTKSLMKGIGLAADEFIKKVVQHPVNRPS
jgi:hypothetical protein